MKVDFNKIKLFDNEYLYVLEYQIKLQIDALIELVESDEKSIAQFKVKFRQLIKTAKFRDIEIQHQDVFQEHLIDRELITEKLIIQKWYSTCLMTFSVFEGLIEFICEEIDQNIDSKIKHSDLKGNDDLLRYKKYLEDIVDIDFCKITPSFTKLKQQKIVRNKIAHNSGKIENPKKIQIINGIKVENNQIIIYDKIYFDALIQAVREFFENLLKELDLKIKFR